MIQPNRRNPLVRVLGSIKLALVLLGAFAIATAVATFLEVRFGTEGARALVYNARWFEILLGLLIVNLIVSLFARMPYHRFQTGFVITHIAFIIVLLSAGITRYFGYEGTMPIREGSSTDFLYSTKDYVQITSGGETTSFPARLWKPGKTGISRKVKAGGDDFDVRVVEYWPRFEHRMTETPGGEPVIVYSGAGMGRRREAMGIGETVGIEGVTLHFLAEDRDIGTGAPNGELLITVGGDVHRLDVPTTPPVEVSAGGYRFRITEFARNFRVGQESSPTDPMNNPAIRVQIESASGETGERLLFAFHPDFDMGHSGHDSKEFDELDLRYHFGRSFYVFKKDSGGLGGRADFVVGVQGMGHSDSTWSIPAGESFDVTSGQVFHSGDFAFLMHDYWESAVEEAALSEDERAPAAARIAVEDGAGNTAEAIVEKFSGPVPVDLGGREVSLSYGPVRLNLPYRLHLDDFLLVTYPGSENPASFESHVRIYDEERGVDGEPVRIFMNNPLDYRGFRHFQSSYDQDRKGTILSVNHDPGKLPTYFGYTLLTVGLLIALTRGLLWHRPVKRQRGA
jgi:hypothetical protein